MGSVPHRTSYELLPAELGACYSVVDLQRTLGGRL